MQELDLVKLYEDGTHRRYSLLFSVNGGAFAIAKLMFYKSNSDHLLGRLSLMQLSFGMAGFTAFMIYDIVSFGLKMRKQLQGLLHKKDVDMFGWEGRCVLVGIGLLIFFGWIRAGWH